MVINYWRCLLSPFKLVAEEENGGMKVYADNEEEFRLLLKELERFTQFKFQMEREETLPGNAAATATSSSGSPFPSTPVATSTAAVTVGSISTVIFNSNKTETGLVFFRYMYGFAKFPSLCNFSLLVL